MKKLALSLMSLLMIASFAHAETASYLKIAAGEMKQILSLPELNAYSDYTIDNIRQGETSVDGQEVQGYVLRLVKPFASDNAGLCLTFVNMNGAWKKTFTSACDN